MPPFGIQRTIPIHRVRAASIPGVALLHMIGEPDFQALPKQSETTHAPEYAPSR